MDLGLAGRIAVVTGGSSGIGAACVRQFAAEGAKVAIGYRTNAADAGRVRAEAEALGVSAAVFRHELGQRDDTAGLAKLGMAVESLLPAQPAAPDGRRIIDALVTCAVAWPDHPPRSERFSELVGDDWRRTVSDNLIGTMASVQHVLPALTRPGGRIVMVSSTMGADGHGGAVAYAAAKSGLVGFCRSIVAEYGPDGIVANVVMPGLTDTDRQRPRRGSELLERTAAATPTRRLTTVDDVARLVVFLSSPAHSGVAGEVVRVAGGA